jgi:hypothetical protein
MTATFNPIATRLTVIDTSEPAIHEPAATVVAEQDPTHTEADFLRDLDKATRRDSEPS